MDQSICQLNRQHPDWLHVDYNRGTLQHVWLAAETDLFTGELGTVFYNANHERLENQRLSVQWLDWLHLERYGGE